MSVDVGRPVRCVQTQYTLAKKVAYMAKFKVAFLLMYTCVAKEAI